MACAYLLYRVAVAFCMWAVQATDATTPNYPALLTEKCFATPQGTVDRSNQKLRIGMRNWLTAELTSKAFYFVMKEVMRYDVELLDLSGAASSKAWGQEMAADMYDFEMESWQAGTAQPWYLEWVVQKQAVRVGNIGYGGRSGLFSTPKALLKQPFADYYLFYKDSKLLKDTGYVMFGEQIGIDAVKEALDGDGSGTGGISSKFPVCTKSDLYPFCGEAGSNFENSYVPPQCLDKPEDCAVAYMHSPSYDRAYFEQLTTNHGLKLVHQWVSNKVETAVNIITKQGREAVFYHWVPDPFPNRVNAQRISFPDYSFGCTGGDTGLPSGPISCDYGDILLNKLARDQLRKDAPEALFVWMNTEIYGHQMDQMISWTDNGGGNLTTWGSACRFLKENPDAVERWAPECVSRPKEILQNGDLIFQPQNLACEVAARFPERVLTEQCFKPPPGKKDRTDENPIRIAVRGWSSQQLAAYSTALVLKEWLGYEVLMVDATVTSTKTWGPDMEGGGFDVEPESWQAGSTTEVYQKYVVQRQTVLNPGQIGYTGRSGMFMFPSAKNSSVFASYWRFYKEQDRIDASNFIHYPGQPYLPTIKDHVAKYGDPFPSCDKEWCGTGQFEGYWVPPVCETEPENCLLVIHAYPNYDTAFFEQLTYNLGLKLIFAYYGVSGFWPLVNKTYFEEPTKALLFYMWSPDTGLATVNAVRLSFPDHVYGCSAGDTKEPTGPIGCDYGDTPLQKLVSKTVSEQTPEAYMFLKNWQILKEDIDRMLQLEAQGLSTFNVTCEWAKENQAKIGSIFAPPCISDPIPIANLRIRDRTFDSSTFSCPEVKCNPDQVLRTRGSVYCDTCKSGQTPNEEGTDCVACDLGTVPDRSQGTCKNCTLGHICPQNSEVPEPCPLGSYASQASMTECMTCPTGKYNPSSGSADCNSCPSPMTTGLEGAKFATSCICPKGYYKPLNVTNDSGYPWAETADVCLGCPEGLECAEGSDQSNVPCDGNRLISMADRTPGMLSRSKDGQLLYPIPPEKFFTTCEDLEGLSCYKCLSEKACPGGDVDECGGGTEGIACGRCQDGYYKTDEECKKCNDVEASNGIFPALPIVIAPPCIVFMYMVSRDRLEKWNSPANYLASALFCVLVYVQTLAAISACYLQKPPAMSGSSEWTAYAFELLSLLRPGCTTFSDFQTSFIGKLLLPIYALVLYVFVFADSVILGFIRKQFRMDGDIMTNCYFSLFNTFFIGIAQQTFTLFQCYEHPNGKKSMRSQANVLCESSQWNDLVAVALVAVVAFCGGFLALNIYVVVVAPRKFVNPRFQMRYKFAFIKYRPSIWWWGVVMLVKGIWLNMPTVVFDTGAAQMIWLEGIIVSYFVLSFGLFPWRSFLVGALDVLQHAFLIFLFGFVPHFIPSDEPEIDDRIGVAYAFFSMCPLACGAFVVGLLVVKRLCPRISHGDWHASAEEVCATFSEIKDPKMLAKIMSQLPWSDLLNINSTRNILRMTYLFDKHPKPMMAKSALLSTSNTAMRLQAESEVSDYMGSDYTPQKVIAKEEDSRGKDNNPEPEAELTEDVPTVPKGKPEFTREDVLDALDFPPEQMHDLHVMSDMIGLLTPRFEPIGAPRTPRTPRSQLATPRSAGEQSPPHTPREVGTPREDPPEPIADPEKPVAEPIDDSALPLTPRG